ncbi:U3 associated protein Utp25 [Schizosaccharomyces octosporus yFS286]|uniref:U3 small nucleolar RNA-associated protein 25 n=1 Tax=Schizosaccharomyces octosporus (strain yFS286) TaxID=483514 RepID=S9RC88_SCHOY|nr:U3 associated protein Utp25 [Schizosaccharomyces octosporus yFS286]EPX71739.1 U3 associated protein Utp25 [Schizosaccharomyces octosporus yFS286]
MAGFGNIDEMSKDVLAGKSYEALLYLMHNRKKRKPEKKSENEDLPKHKEKKNKVIEKLDEPDTNEEENESYEEKEIIDALAHEDFDNADEKESETSQDPFISHFDCENMQVINESISCIKAMNWSQSSEETKLGISQIFTPETEEKIPYNCIPKSDNVSDLGLKQRILEAFKSQKPSGHLTTMQMEIAKHMFNYQDVFFTNMNFKSHKLIVSLYALHSLNHVFKTRDRILKNSARLSQNPELEFRDQGYTRPKVLVLLPTRNSCLEFINTLISYSGADQVANRKRFEDDFSIEKEVISEKKPEDFRYLFAGNTDDMFRIGIKFTRKTIKLFSQFYNSDIIVASPLGLRLAIGNKGDKKRDLDFLSSIEVSIIDQADALYMQNWEHIEAIFDEINNLPREAHDCDFSRVRPWYLDQQSKYMRQTVLFSQYNALDINSFFSHYMLNVAGKVKFRTLNRGILNQLGYKIKQTYVRVSSDSIVKLPDARFFYFINSVLPHLVKSPQGGILVYVPSYFDFVRIRNHMDDEAISYSAISEYSSTSDLTRARTLFQQSKTKILLYTERAHHFRRFDIRGVKAIVMFAPPTNPQYYVELARMPMRSITEGKLDQDAAKCRILFSKYDSISLEGIVGFQRVPNMCHGRHEVFEFV